MGGTATASTFLSDPDFLKASPADQRAYLSHVDSDFAKASPADQDSYLQHVLGANQTAPEQKITSDLPESTQALSGQYLSPEAQTEANKQMAPIAGAETGMLLSGPLAAAGGGALVQAGLQGALGAGMGGETAAGKEGATNEDILNGALVGGAVGAGTGLLSGVPKWFANTKIGRSFINESVGATGRDVTYGNPAKALLNEGIINPRTGDWEAMKATRQLADAGGRLGQVSNRISELQPQLNSQLASSAKTISMADAVDKPLNAAFDEIMANNAITMPEKEAAIRQLGDLQQALHTGHGSQLTPLEANILKNQVGGRVRWTGTNAVGDDVKPYYKQVYNSLREWVNSTVPGTEGLNDRLTDLHAAKDDLVRLSKNEEVSRGAGALGGTIGKNIIGRLESQIGRYLPASASVPLRVLAPLAIGSIPALGTPQNPNPTVTGLP
jgi:hypothetical protein